MTADHPRPDPDRHLPPCAEGRCEGRCARRLPATVGDVLRAAYAGASTPDGPLRVQRGWVTLRLDPDAVAGAVLVQPAVAPGAEPMPELRLCGVDDRTVHRCHPLLPEDRLVIEGLARLDDRLPGEAFDVQPRGPERGPDDLPDQLQRIDDLLTWTMARTAFLPHRHIEPGVLPSVIEHACAVGLPLGIAVFSDAAMHAVQDTVQSVAHAAGVMAVGTEEAILEIRPAAVQHCLLLRLHGPHGPTSCLELYDAADRRVVLISQFGIVDGGAHDAWEHLAASLPELT